MNRYQNNSTSQSNLRNVPPMMNFNNALMGLQQGRQPGQTSDQQRLQNTSLHSDPRSSLHLNQNNPFQQSQSFVSPPQKPSKLAPQISQGDLKPNLPKPQKDAKEEVSKLESKLMNFQKEIDEIKKPKQVDDTQKKEKNQSVETSNKKKQDLNKSAGEDLYQPKKKESVEQLQAYVDKKKNQVQSADKGESFFEPIQPPSDYLKQLEMQTQQILDDVKPYDQQQENDQEPIKMLASDDRNKSAPPKELKKESDKKQDTPQTMLNKLLNQQQNVIYFPDDASRIRYLEDRVKALNLDLERLTYSFNEKVYEIQQLKDITYKKNSEIDIKNQGNVQLNLYIAEQLTIQKDLENQLAQSRAQTRQFQEDLKIRTVKIQTQKAEFEGQLTQAKQQIQVLLSQSVDKDCEINQWKNYNKEDKEIAKQREAKILYIQDNVAKLESDNLKLNNFLKMSVLQNEEFVVIKEQLLKDQKTLNQQIIDLESQNHQYTSKIAEISLLLQDRTKEIKLTQSQLQQAQQCIKDRNVQIETLEAEKYQLDLQLQDHTNNLSNKQVLIEETVKRHGKVKEDVATREKELQSLRQTISELADQCSSLNQQVSILSTEIQYETTQNSALSSQNEIIKKELQQQQENQKKIEEEVYKQTTQNKLINQDNEDLKGKNEILSSTLKELNSSLMVIESQFHQITLEKEEMKTLLLEKHELVDENKYQQQITSCNLEENKDSIQKLEGQITQLNVNLQQKIHDLQDKQQEINNLQKFLNDSKKEINLKDKELLNLNKKFNELSENSKVLLQFQDQQKKDLQNLKTQNDKLSQLTESQKNNSVFQKEESNKLEQEKNKLENLLKQKNQEIDALKVNIQSYVQDRTQMNSTIIDLESQIHQQQLDKELLKEQLADKHSEMDSHKFLQNNTSQNLKEKEKNLNQSDLQIKYLNSKLEENSIQIAKYQQEIEDSKKKNLKLSKDLDQKESEKTQLKDDKLDLGQQLQQQKYTIDDYLMKISDLTRAQKKDLEDFDKKYQKLQYKLNESEESYKKYLGELQKSKDDQLSIASNKLQTLQNQSKETQQSQAKEIAALQASIVSLENLKKFQYLELLSKFNEYKQEKEEEIQNQQKQIEKQEKVSKKTTSSLQDHEENKISSQQEILQLKQKVTDQLERIEYLEENVSHLEQSLQNSEEEVNKLNPALENSKEQIEKINTYYNNREKEFKAMKAGLEKTLKGQDLIINSKNNNIGHLETDIKSANITIHEYEKHIIELEAVEQQYFKLNKEMEQLTTFSREQELELGDWRFQYAQFMQTQEQNNNLLLNTFLYNVTIQSLRQQIRDIKDEQEKNNKEQKDKEANRIKRNSIQLEQPQKRGSSKFIAGLIGKDLSVSQIVMHNDLNMLNDSLSYNR